MIEAEYKARLSEPENVRSLLNDKVRPAHVTYQDTYFDRDDTVLADKDRELRLRTISGAGNTEHLLTFKDAAADQATGSKPEFETTVTDRNAMEEILTRLGYRSIISFTKNCENYTYIFSGRELLATLVTVPEIEGTFLEVETLVPGEDDLRSALSDLRSALTELGITPDQLTVELYTDAVARSRQQ